MKVVDAENPLDLSEKSGQEPEVSTGHPYEACYHFRDQLFDLPRKLRDLTLTTQATAMTRPGRAGEDQDEAA